ncbi:MAG: hypothetical protein M1546_18955 [Chloroflexi bacterium]|nr:hypothetical protein [Chloroflexota bacterium]
MTTKKNPHAVALGRKGGKATSERKRAAVRENGRKGEEAKAFIWAKYLRCLDEWEGQGLNPQAGDLLNAYEGISEPQALSIMIYWRKQRRPQAS